MMRYKFCFSQFASNIYDCIVRVELKRYELTKEYCITGRANVIFCAVGHR